MIFDVLFVVLAVLGLRKGYQKGFARQMLTIVGIVLGVVFGEMLTREAMPVVSGELERLPINKALHGPVLAILSLLAIWGLIVLFGTMYLQWYRNNVLGIDAPSFGDRLFGCLLGVGKAAFYGFLFCYLFNLAPEWIRERGFVPEQKRTSRGFAFAEQNQFVDKLVETQEVRQYRAHLLRLVQSLTPAAKPAEQPTVIDRAKEELLGTVFPK